MAGTAVVRLHLNSAVSTQRLPSYAALPPQTSHVNNLIMVSLIYWVVLKINQRVGGFQDLYRSLEETDPELSAIIKDEEMRQRRGLELIASEVLPSVRNVDKV